MSGMDQAMTNRLTLCKKDTESCELDEATQYAMKVGREAPKTRLRKIFGGWL